MGEQVEDQINEPCLNNLEVTFDNFTILKEFSNIANLVRNEDFLETVPKAKLKRVKWVPMFNYLKQRLLDEMIQEVNAMWEFENMPEKLQVLELQKEKFSVINPEREVWRPQHNNLKAQLKAADVVNLKKQKMLLESLANDYEVRVNRLKKIITAKRGYLKSLQMDICKYQNKTEEFVAILGERIEMHKKLVPTIIPVQIDISTVNWSAKEFLEGQ